MARGKHLKRGIMLCVVLRLVNHNIYSFGLCQSYGNVVINSNELALFEIG